MKVNKSDFLEKSDGICAIVIHKNRVLLIRRHWLPIIRNPNIWSFVFGTRENGETHISTAYRELEEETGLGRKNVKLAYKPIVVKLFDIRKRSVWWNNHLYVFKSNSEKVKLDIENTGFRWASFTEIKSSNNYTNIFVDKQRIEKLIKRALHEE